MAKMAIFGFWAIFRGLALASKSKLQKNEKTVQIYYYMSKSDKILKTSRLEWTPGV